MSTSVRYDSIAARLTSALPTLRPRLRDPLICALVGMSQAVSAQQRAVAAAMPLTTKQSSKIQRFRRLLDTGTLTDAGGYQPIVRAALTGLCHQRVHVLLDRVVLTDTQNVVVVSLGFHRRSIPLVWQILPHAGSSNLVDQQTVLTAAVALLPPRVQVIIHADSEFRSQTLYTWVRDHGWDAIMGIRGNIRVSTDPATIGFALTSGQSHHTISCGYVILVPCKIIRAHRACSISTVVATKHMALLRPCGKAVSTPNLYLIPYDAIALALTSWLPDRDTVAYLNQVWLTEDCCGPANVLAWWDKDDRGVLTCYAVMTNLPATWQTYRIGSRRMWIETMFRDWQSGGFDLGKTAITNPERFHRLIILVCLVYLWFVSVGRWLVKRGYRTLLDAGPSDAWQQSLFTLAIAWQNRCRTFDRPLPVFWFVYM